MNQQPVDTPSDPVQRVRIWYAALLLVFGLFALRAFHLQIIRHDYYQKAALSDQLRQYSVPARRGEITAQLGEGTVPLVMNQKLYTLYADPKLVKDPDAVAAQLQAITGADKAATAKTIRDYAADKKRYVALGKKLTQQQSDKVTALKAPGIGTEEQDYRTYPQGQLASQVLGFVNNDGKGVYGIEQALNKQLSGKEGQLKAITDVNGVPLAASSDNLSTEPVAGKNVNLTLNIGMQSQLEKIIAEQNKTLKAERVSALVMDPNTGAIKAMANTPTYDPAQYDKVQNADVFTNGAVASAIEPGSIMKLLTVAAALNQGTITTASSFNDPGTWKVDGSTIKDVVPSTGRQTPATILNLSLNTGATWLLMQMGGGQLNSKGRDAWHDYMVRQYLLGQQTGIEQGYEAEGYVPKPDDNGAGINLTYANTTFGQAVTATPVQMAGAIASIINGGTYYRPYLVDSVTDGNGNTVVTKPEVLKKNVVSKATSDAMVNLMQYVITEHRAEGFSYLNFGSQYSVGGKTGTAQLALPTGGYDETHFNGTYAGFVGGDSPQYLVVLYTEKPQVLGNAGTSAAQGIFAAITHMLINNFEVTPKSS